MTKKSIAIIGSGISGLSAAYQLDADFEVTVFEKSLKLGGHTDTHTFDIEQTEWRVDSGFIIFCPQYYPNFSAMLEALKVEKQPTNMSFSAHNPRNDLVYNASSLNALFCQRRNLFRSRFWRMLFDIVRFYHTAANVLKSTDCHLSVADYLKQHRYGPGFIEDHLMPMISALWSATPQRVNEFPIRHLVDFFMRHGLMKLIKRPQWYVVKNGSASYVEALQDKLSCTWKLNTKVNTVFRKDDQVSVIVDDQTFSFDAVVIATHADQALKLLGDASEDEQRILGAIPFERNGVIVHTDASLMPKNKLAWASWNTEVPDNFDDSSKNVCTANYWMNLLQGINTQTPIFTSLNSLHKIDQQKVLAKRIYHHPVFTAESVAAQADKSKLDGQRKTYFVGAYWGWGFHEDGARSAAQVCQQLRADLS